jgi:hypothetical protein
VNKDFAYKWISRGFKLFLKVGNVNVKYSFKALSVFSLVFKGIRKNWL